MPDDQSPQPPHPPPPPRRMPSIGEGIRTGVGILSAFKEAIEETISEAMSRGDVKPESAQGVVDSAVNRAREAMADAPADVEGVPRGELEALQAQVLELRHRVAALEARHGHAAAAGEGYSGEPANPSDGTVNDPAF
ncbi:MAG TPA: hypothetical protein VFX98_09820 [Longimicrobiaceae bacterium]|nr:hypothetical protein [Longimicrobiaceae bacterium]